MKGVVVWFTGRPSSGKSFLAGRVAEGLRARGSATCLLDGDEVRAALSPRPGYSEPERDRFYQTLARFAALIARQGLIVLVAATAHRRRYRELARELAPAFVEVYLDVDAATCRARDAKGLYAELERGGIANLPGADAGYEIPSRPDVVAHGGEDARALEQVLGMLGAGEPPRVAHGLL
jgi:adenylylsulfate kinase